MTNEHIKSLIQYLENQNELFNRFDNVCVTLNKAEVQHIVKCLRDRKEPTREEVESYCKARELSLISNSLLSELISRK